MTIHGLRSKNKYPVTSSWLPMRGMKPDFIARTMCWSSAAVTAPGRTNRCMVVTFSLALLWWSIPVWYTWITCESQPNLLPPPLLDLWYGGSNYLDVGCEGEKVWDVGGISLGCVIWRSPITPLVQVWSTVLTHILSGSIVSTLLVGLDCDAHSLWILVYAPFFILYFIVYTIYDLSILCDLVLSHQLSSSSNYKLEHSGL